MKFDPIMVVSSDCANVDKVTPLAILDFQAGLHLVTEPRSPGCDWSADLVERRPSRVAGEGDRREGIKR
jgi:hypothetical protein